MMLCSRRTARRCLMDVSKGAAGLCGVGDPDGAAAALHISTGGERAHHVNDVGHKGPPVPEAVRTLPASPRPAGPLPPHRCESASSHAPAAMVRPRGAAMGAMGLVMRRGLCCPARPCACWSGRPPQRPRYRARTQTIEAAGDTPIGSVVIAADRQRQRYACRTRRGVPRVQPHERVLCPHDQGAPGREARAGPAPVAEPGEPRSHA